MSKRRKKPSQPPPIELISERCLEGGHVYYYVRRTGDAIGADAWVHVESGNLNDTDFQHFSEFEHECEQRIVLEQFRRTLALQGVEEKEKFKRIRAAEAELRQRIASEISSSSVPPNSQAASSTPAAASFDSFTLSSRRSLPVPQPQLPLQFDVALAPHILASAASDDEGDVEEEEEEEEEEEQINIQVQFDEGKTASSIPATTSSSQSREEPTERKEQVNLKPHNHSKSPRASRSQPTFSSPSSSSSKAALCAVCDELQAPCWVETPLSPTESSLLLTCQTCSVKVHAGCYGVTLLPLQDSWWWCSACDPSGLQRHIVPGGAGERENGAREEYRLEAEQEGKEALAKWHADVMPEQRDVYDARQLQCKACMQTGGALKPVSFEFNYMHVLCARYLPDKIISGWPIPLHFFVLDKLVVADVYDDRKALLCEICKLPHLTYLVKCGEDGCSNRLHPTCARAKKCKFVSEEVDSISSRERKGESGERYWKHMLFCPKHSHNSDEQNGNSALEEHHKPESTRHVRNSKATAKSGKTAATVSIFCVLEDDVTSAAKGDRKRKRIVETEDSDGEAEFIGSTSNTVEGHELPEGEAAETEPAPEPEPVTKQDKKRSKKATTTDSNGHSTPSSAKSPSCNKKSKEKRVDDGPSNEALSDAASKYKSSTTKNDPNWKALLFRLHSKHGLPATYLKYRSLSKEQRAPLKDDKFNDEIIDAASKAESLTDKILIVHRIFGNIKPDASNGISDSSLPQSISESRIRPLFKASLYGNSSTRAPVKAFEKLPWFQWQPCIKNTEARFSLFQMLIYWMCAPEFFEPVGEVFRSPNASTSRQLFALTTAIIEGLQQRFDDWSLFGFTEANPTEISRSSFDGRLRMQLKDETVFIELLHRLTKRFSHVALAESLINNVQMLTVMLESFHKEIDVCSSKTSQRLPYQPTPFIAKDANGMFAQQKWQQRMQIVYQREAAAKSIATNHAFAVASSDSVRSSNLHAPQPTAAATSIHYPARRAPPQSTFTHAAAQLLNSIPHGALSFGSQMSIAQATHTPLPPPPPVVDPPPVIAQEPQALPRDFDDDMPPLERS